jgi:hypothetical protein
MGVLYIEKWVERQAGRVEGLQSRCELTRAMAMEE